MEEGKKFVDSSGFMVKNRSSTGCLIVRKNAGTGGGGGDGAGMGMGSSGGRKVFEGKKEKKRAKMDFSDSASSDEQLMPTGRKLGSDTISVCNGLSDFHKRGIGESDASQKRNKGGDFRCYEVGVIGRIREDLGGRKRNRSEVFELDEYEGNGEEMVRRRRFDDGDLDKRRFFGSTVVGRSSIGGKHGTGSSRHDIADRITSANFDGPGGLSRGDHNVRAAPSHPISFLRHNNVSDEPIRVQGKNGVLKVMVNKKKKIGGSMTKSTYDRFENEENIKGLRTEDTVKRNIPIRPFFHSEPEHVEKVGVLVGTDRKPSKPLKSFSAKHHKVSEQDAEDSDTPLKMGPKAMEMRNPLKTPFSTEKNKGHHQDSEDGNSLLMLGLKNVETRKSMKSISSEGEKMLANQLPPTRVKEGKVKRGTGTEKQKLRERIRGMLLDAGWTIDYRPRKNRDYLDAVYINPGGTAYWSIIKAYDALLKQLNDDEDEVKPRNDPSPFMPLSDEVLSQLTRKTSKKIEKEMKKKRRDDIENEIVRKSSSLKHHEESMDSGRHEEKLSSFIKKNNKPAKGRFNSNSCFTSNSKGQTSVHHLHDNSEEPSSGSISCKGRKTRKLGRCTLLVRNSNQGLNSGSDGFVPHAGKLTLLAWLIDSGTVQPSQKVRYMNRRRTKVMLEGWVTKDGIHCGCCSKILTVSKFEIHAGSKLRQPFQNIYLDSGISLLECQVDAWNRQESIEGIGFHSVDIDCDEPNDDTCGLCGDGGNLICCDGCPSTFHRSCLDIKMLPPGDWHCPNCACRFCGAASENILQDHSAHSMLLICAMCAKKYHKSCTKEIDTFSLEVDSFCGKKCQELLEQLQRYLGVKKELEAGFSWSLIHRTDTDLDSSLQGLPQRVECNSKLAVALSVMDECFLPIVDRRSGINLIHNVLYNCGSNFNRLNFHGFYTAILERGDEIISAASIRFHGARFVEMPFIGTRHIYRRQGMCRRLFCALEMVLCSLKVEKLIIPAISELTKTWMEVFGFTTLDESLKQELKYINMLVFPGIDMLQKQLLEQGKIDGNLNISKGVTKMEIEGSQCKIPDLTSKFYVDSSNQCGQKCSNSDSEHASETDDVATDKSDSQCPDIPSNDASVMNKGSDIESCVKVDEYSLDKKDASISIESNGLQRMTKNAGFGSPVTNTNKSCFQGDVTMQNSGSYSGDNTLGETWTMDNTLDASREFKNPIAL
ncbi:hypothetical protein K2173_021542 [Erythroxylum novogranatense]|uniref:PHD-type domain-containing protein n=1 Tax=Erythroxylum novogranatense TaxID=1862640 RepID=A0AAV8TR61_9ROSI|nr:hypothetical protein K2173_021542 [Erythroxylum novogranatense]